MKTKKLRNNIFLKPVFLIRDFLWEHLGFFKLKKNLKRKLYFRRAANEDAKRRKQIALQILSLPNNIFPIFKEGSDKLLIVSMTSYGKRVKETCPYALYSIITQKHRPNRIVLNIDKKSWNNDNLPDLLKKLQKVGVEINFIEDIGPHTKLIPTLKKYPNDIIITADDDVLYDDVMVAELWNAYNLSDKKTVICRDATNAIDKDESIIIYSKQPHVTDSVTAMGLIPLGVAGVLYPPHIFTDEVFNYEIIRSLCPKADDIWFGIMELLSGIAICYLENNSFNEVDVDRNEEYNPDVSGALHFKNDGQGQNDIQWENLVRYYKLNQ